MDYPNCRMFGFDQATIDNTLKLLGLTDQDHATAETLHTEVINPNINDIIEAFYTYLQQHEKYTSLFSPGEQLTNMMQMQENYLRTLGVNFHSPDYFEERLKIGITHYHIGLEPRLYEYTYSKLHELICEQISEEMDSDSKNRIMYFLNRIVTLDRSLALESYHQTSLGKLETSINELEETSDKFKQRSGIDTLTGAVERSTMIEKVNHLLAGFKKSGDIFSIAMCDIDGLTKVNDSFGHMAGDLVLKSFVREVKAKIRSMDSIGRYGGDLFMLLFPGSSENNTIKVIQDIQQHLLQYPVKIGSHEYIVKLLIGVSEVKDDDDLLSLLQRVDSLLVSEEKKVRRG